MVEMLTAGKHNVDGTTIESINNTLRLKDLGITNAKVSATADIVESKILFSTSGHNHDGITSKLVSGLQDVSTNLESADITAGGGGTVAGAVGLLRDGSLSTRVASEKDDGGESSAVTQTLVIDFGVNYALSNIIADIYAQGRAAGATTNTFAYSADNVSYTTIDTVSSTSNASKAVSVVARNVRYLRCTASASGYSGQSATTTSVGINELVMNVR